MAEDQLASASVDRLQHLRRAFLRFGEVEATAQQSPIYERLSNLVAGDTELLSVSAHASSGQPAPNLFFGCVHALLDEYHDHPLATYYPSTGGQRAIDAGLDEAFQDFVLAYREEIIALLQTRLVQTNEVRRSVALLPAFAEVTWLSGAPLALIEVGPAAGLNLLFDRYRYDYSGLAAGDPASELALVTEVRGELPPVAVLPDVAYRCGIDLNALDVRSDEDVRWLRALLWPEHADRRAVLDAAIEIARRDPPTLASGDLFTELPRAIAAAPTEASVVVFATFVLNQFTTEMRERLRAMLFKASQARVVWLVVVGYQDYFTDDIGEDGSAQVWLARIDGSVATARRLGRTSPHGWWIEWAPGPDQPWQ